MINTENTGLIVVDVQGKLARMVHDSERCIANIAKLISGCKTLGLPIVWLEQYPQGLGPTVTELSELLSPLEPIEKTHFNALEEPDVEDKVAQLNKQNWLVCGIEAHICVYQTVMGLLERNYTVEVVVDSISSREEESIAVAMHQFNKNGVGITNVEMCLYQLMKSSKNPHFKEVLQLIK